MWMILYALMVSKNGHLDSAGLHLLIVSLYLLLLDTVAVVQNSSLVHLHGEDM